MAESIRRWWTVLSYCALLAAALVLSAVQPILHAGADSPHTGLDLSIGVGAQCDSTAGPAQCDIEIGQPFTLNFKVNTIPTGFTYAGYDASIDYTGVTVNALSLVQQGAGVWPSCAFPAFDFSVAGTIAAACGYGGVSPSTYAGVLMHVEFTCAAPGTITLQLGAGESDLTDQGFVPHSEAAGTESLAISCAQTSYSEPMTVAAGGTLATDYGDMLTVPAGALTADTSVSLDIGEPPAIPLPPGVVGLPRAYTFGPSGLTFEDPATVVFSYAGVDIGSADPASLQVYIFNSLTDTWDLLGGVVDTTAKTITVELGHFSTYGLFRDGGVDTDGDQCKDGKEVGPDEKQGGRRDWQNPWDYFNPEKVFTPVTQTVADIIRVVQQFNKDDNDGNPGLPPYASGYTPDTDRTTVPGGYAWSLGPPNGQQRVDDILAAVKQFGHNCGP